MLATLALLFQFLMAQCSWPSKGLGIIPTAHQLVPAHPFHLSLNVITPNLIPLLPPIPFILSVNTTCFLTVGDYIITRVFTQFSNSPLLIVNLVKQGPRFLGSQLQF
jgi:hypothetical protein